MPVLSKGIKTPLFTEPAITVQADALFGEVGLCRFIARIFKSITAVLRGEIDF